MLKGSRFVRFVFCLGFAGAAYYSYGAVRTWISPKPSISTHPQGFSEKSPVFMNQAEIQRQVIAGFSGSAPMGFVPTSQPILETSSSGDSTGELVPSEPPLVSTDGQDEKKEEIPAAELAESVSPENIAGMPQPYYPDFSQDDPAEEKMSKASGMSESRDPSSVSPSAPLMVGPNPAVSAAAPVASSAAISEETSDQNHPFSSLTGGDYQALNTSMKGSFPSGSEVTSGTLCQVEHPVCSYEDQYSVNSRAWAMQKVLQENVNFQVRQVGQSISFDVGFKVLTQSNQEEDVSFRATPTSVHPHREFENSTHYRVLDFNFPNMEIHGEPVKNVRASLVFEETATGLQLSNQSKFTFQRNDVSVDVTNSTDYFTAQDLNFSIKVEKLL